MGGVTRGVFPTDPIRTFWSVLTLPNGDAVFDLVDQKFAGEKGFSSMGAACSAYDCQVSNTKFSDAMNRGQTNHRVPESYLAGNRSHLAFRHRDIRMVFKRDDRQPFV